MQISATTYIDFLFATGTTRVRVVREARRKYEQPYAQGSDYYRPLREGIVAMHRDGLDPSTMDEIVIGARPERRENFKACVDGYRRWLLRQGIVWTRRPSPNVWTRGELEVRLNPELLLTVDGRPHRVKLYVRGKPSLSQRRANLLIHLLKAAGDDGTSKVGILDVRKARLFTQTATSPDFEVLLDAEALSFAAMWNATGEGGQQQRPAIS